VGRTLFASTGGVLANRLGWVGFFLLASAATLPALVLLVWIARRGAALSKDRLRISAATRG
jgi:MFS transporter, PAT family, beta-lactamase induction signal transducer AmpG